MVYLATIWLDIGYNGIMFLELVAWWYVQGWLEAWRTARHWIANVQRAFSTAVLLRSLFSPWKQIVTFADNSINQKLQALIDNLLSRAVGFTVRLSALLAAAVLTVLAALAGLLLIIAWPLLPPVIIYCLIRSIL
jgi:hypothetical protein